MGYTAHGVDVSREDVQKIVDAADKDGTGLLTEKEFVNSQAVGDAMDDHKMNEERPKPDTSRQAEIAFRFMTRTKMVISPNQRWKNSPKPCPRNKLTRFLLGSMPTETVDSVTLNSEK